MVEAIIWDYDGTLVDTRQKNLNVTRRIVFEVLNRSLEEFPVLLNIENYQQANTKAVNWRDLYATAFGMSEEQTDYAGSLWTKHQLLDDTEAQFYQGLHETIIGFGGSTRRPLFH
jgi:beta-phosphoglucomutase-like phosphatase (HAD superfamily)